MKIPFGNIKDQNTKNIYNNTLSRIIKLSSLNNTYCLCDPKKCRYAHKIVPNRNFKKLNTEDFPKKLEISIDKSCNLKCGSCRNYYYSANNEEQKEIEKIANEIIKTGWLSKSNIVLACQGEVFFSKNYIKLLTTDIKRKSIHILTNGTLFNENKWKLVEEKYNEIIVEVSIDAATSETYKKIRNGNFEKLLKNLKMLGNLRKQGKISKLQFNFTVQMENYLEMIKFIQMSKELNVDKVQFSKLDNWRTYSNKEYKKRSLIVNGKYLDYNFYLYLQNPIFKDKIVELSSLEPYLINSNKYYVSE